MTDVQIESIETDELDYSNDDLFNITSWGADMSFRELISMYDDNELLKPELQRKYVWDKVEASRFIESILLGLPIPSIFLARTVENNMLIIDGYQRIMTVYDYVKKGIFSKDNSIFRLTKNEKINERWRGKAFHELSESDQKKIRQTTIHAIIFESKNKRQDRNDSSLYQIFERINTSGKVLKPQEIRNCVYQGPLNRLLFELNLNLKWRALFGSQLEDSRMSDLEFILRFLGLKDSSIKDKNEGQISLKKYLNDFMGNEVYNTDSYINESKNIFIDTMNKIYELFGDNAFHNLSSDGVTYQSRFHPTIFDSISIATAYAIEKNINFSHIENVRDKHMNLLNNSQFKEFITIRTTNVEHINGRIKLATSILYGIDYD
ncbi:DUF262 domain-containing protein [Actinobacillus equuli]|uniref:DUF262 domain-containing protein n=1 Tax=Actinobacillus equuli TaxID=718 RepID=UPI002441369B|nr:DUF262 domain-containing protein [Actinobacillus equuli]WGE59492.1 DUF262 domain-containing protein [Actinobacillus equuli subsp. haemolyticus]WGE61867.1 DUF262 domain-containing protein [Actinobacillus equuli subsp. haemolyticus]